MIQNFNLKNKNHQIILTFGIILITFYLSIFQINEFQTAFIIRFGKIIRSLDKSGLNFKLPILDEIQTFDKRILHVNLPSKELISLDQKRFVVSAYTKYKIVNVMKFYESVRNENGANLRISSALDSVLRQVIASNNITAFLNQDRMAIMQKIKNTVSEQVSHLGVDIVDVRVIKADLPTENSEAIFRRMITDREKEAKELRSEGVEESQKIKSYADKEVSRINSLANMKALEIKGKADSEAMKIYNTSFGKDVEFYKFYKTMEAYKSSINGKNIILGNKNNSFLSNLSKE